MCCITAVSQMLLMTLYVRVGQSQCYPYQSACGSGNQNTVFYYSIVFSAPDLRLSCNCKFVSCITLWKPFFGLPRIYGSTSVSIVWWLQIGSWSLHDLTGCRTVYWVQVSMLSGSCFHLLVILFVQLCSPVSCGSLCIWMLSFLVIGYYFWWFV